MANRDFEINMRMKAEFSAAQRALRDAQQQIEGVGRAVGKVNKEISGAGDSIVAPGTRATDTMRRTALSAKELSFATRNLPAQFTDIATSMAAGQNPMLVLLQQGGQLKDMFGGVGPAARAMGGYIVGLINPLTVAAAATATLVVAWHQGQEESVAFNEALITTGNSAGVTTDQLQDMARSISAEGGTRGSAAAALAEVTREGVFTAEQLRLVGEAAVDMQRVTGQSTGETVKQFAKLADDPVKAVLELNEKTHFLTLTIYEQIKALQDQGREQDAATLAMESYADAIDRRAADITENLGLLETGWRNLAAGAKAAWDAMLDIGREDTASERIEELGLLIHELEQDPAAVMLRAQQSGLPLPANPKAKLAAYKAELRALLAEQRVADREAAQAAAAQRAQEAAMALDQEAAKYASDEAKRARRIAKAHADANAAAAAAMQASDEALAAAGVTSRAELLAKIRADEATVVAGIMAEAKVTPRKPRGTGTAADPDAAGLRRLQSLREEIALLDTLEEGETRASAAAQLRYDLNEGALAEISPALKQQLLDQQALLDQKRADIAAEEERKKAVEELTEAYEDLRDELRTPTEVALEEAIAQVETLNAAFKEGILNKAAYDQDAARIAAGLIDKPPEFKGASPELGGPLAEFDKLDEAAAKEEQWYRESLARLAAFRTEQAGLTAVADAEQEALEARHQNNMRAIEGARQQVALNAAGEFFGQLSTLQRSENSKMAAIGKTAAIAQALINTYQGATAAYAAMAPIPYVGPALGIAAAAAAVAAGLANVAQIRNQPTGYAEGGYTGAGGKWDPAGIVHAEEFVARREVVRQPGARDFLEDFNRNGMKALYGWTGYAEGGLVMPAGPRMAEPSWDRFPQGGLNLPRPQVNQRNYLVLDKEEVGRSVAESSAFETSVLKVITNNPRALGG